MSDPLDRLREALGDRYAIEREIGAGGMATVYLAQDLRHERQVAIKVLRPDLAATLGPERFHREIRIAAQLQHPNILPLLDSGEADDFLFYVMPYVEGQSLRDKLAKEGELPVVDAVRILRDVVDALTEAHEHGVVHRDIKPENILLRGRHALVTDFGVAKAVSEATGREKLTTAGVALGTPAYMAPEQASANPHLDHRVDIYAVGAVAYELLTGRPVFMGTTAQMVLAAHVTEAPQAVTQHRETVPPALDALVMRCLEKKPADRWQRAEDLLPQLEALATPSGGITPTQTRPVAAARTSSTRPVTITIAAVAVAAVLLGSVWIWSGRSAPEPITPGQTTKVTSDPGLELDPAVSPDGLWIAYSAGAVGQRHVYLRQVAGGRAVDLTEELPGNHRHPRWSPDNTSILFGGPGGLYVVPALGGPARKIVDAPAHSAVWMPDGQRIAYVGAGTIRLASIDGTTMEVVTEDFQPHSLAASPDGSRLVYVSGNSSYVLSNVLVGNVAASALHTVALPDGTPHALTEGAHVHQSPVWLPDGRGILYVSDEGGSRDVYQRALAADGAPAGEPSRLTTGLEALTLSLSADGSLLAYSEFRHGSNIWSIQIPGSGTSSVREARQVTFGNQVIEGISVSPDGAWLLFDSNRRGNQDIYRMAMPNGEPEPLTDDPHDDLVPSWSPTGEEIVFYSFRHGSRDIFVMRADGTGKRRLTDNPGQERYPDWSPDGNAIVYQSNQDEGAALWVLSRDGPLADWGEPRQLTPSGGIPRWSPAGDWIAFSGGRVISPQGGDPIRLVEEGDLGGAVPVFQEWSDDGRAVYYKARDSTGIASFWSVPVTGGTPRLLVRFDDPSMPSYRPEFATDGERLYFTVGRQESDIWVMDLER